MVISLPCNRQNSLVNVDLGQVSGARTRVYAPGRRQIIGPGLSQEMRAVYHIRMLFLGKGLHGRPHGFESPDHEPDTGHHDGSARKQTNDRQECQTCQKHAQAHDDQKKTDEQGAHVFKQNICKGQHRADPPFSWLTAGLGVSPLPSWINLKRRMGSSIFPHPPVASLPVSVQNGNSTVISLYIFICHHAPFHGAQLKRQSLGTDPFNRFRPYVMVNQLTDQTEIIVEIN